MTERIGGWHLMWKRNKFWSLDPRPGDFDIEDIAHHLSMVTRYGGALDHHYSVAQHSWLVSYASAPGDQLWGLLHDASEAYIGDMVSPAKRGMPEYKRIEKRIMEAMCEQFELSPEEPASVRRADREVYLAEEKRFRPWIFDAYPDCDAVQWMAQGYRPVAGAIDPWSPEHSEYRFLSKFKYITGASR